MALTLTALNQNINLFYSPTQVMAGEYPERKNFRVGGMVVNGSVHRNAENLEVEFDLTDTAKTVTVAYTGILPDLFREGQGVVLEGRLIGDGSFRADEVLAKHDENYMPKEVADSLKKAGQWKGVDKK